MSDVSNDLKGGARGGEETVKPKAYVHYLIYF